LLGSKRISCYGFRSGEWIHRFALGESPERETINH